MGEHSTPWLGVRRLLADNYSVGSDRHCKSLADRAVDKSSEVGIKPIGVEGTEGGEWILVDLQDVIVHVMQPRTRDFYNLEKLWDMTALRRSQA